VSIAKNTVVSLDYELLGDDGAVIERTEGPVSYLHGGYDGIFPRVEEALEGKDVGYECRVKLEPDDAFGEYEADLVRMESRELFPETVNVGMQFEGSPDDSEETRVYTVTDVTDEKVVVDGNHPLAGRSLIFACTVTAVRPASSEELTHGHVHGPEGHHH
jgi:FKBP-type peptidyl-prolyl cis-trans isomerase SlyD